MEDFPQQKIPEIEYPEIAIEITAMYNADQEMRKRADENNGIIESEEDDTLDTRNTERMREIVDQIGWPTISKVGTESSTNAWLLVQHADHNVEFQSHCLSLMKELPVGEVKLDDIAMLTDRVKVNSGQPQIYGTQFRQIGGEHVPKEIEDTEHLDERRKLMGLDTLVENIERMNKKYPIK